MDNTWKVLILMLLQAIIGLVIWTFVSQTIGAIIVWTAVGIDVIAIGIEKLKIRSKK